MKIDELIYMMVIDITNIYMYTDIAGVTDNRHVPFFARTPKERKRKKKKKETGWLHWIHIDPSD